MLTGASNGLNQIFEKDTDGQMERLKQTSAAGRMSVSQALFWSILAGVIGLGCLYFLNWIAALLGVIALVPYAFVYNPPKSRTAYVCL